MTPKQILEQCARDQNDVLRSAFEEYDNALRHALREAQHNDLGNAPVAPWTGPESSAGASAHALRIGRIAEAAHHYLDLGITEPPGTNDHLIDRFIRRGKTVERDGVTYLGSSVGAEWTTADARTWVIDTPYYKNRMYSWCGAFVGTCMGAAGMLKEHRYNTMPSCTRMLRDWGGTEVEISSEDLEPGDIATVGKASDGRGHKGTHIVLCVERYADHIVTIEGNASWQGREGVIRRTRPYAGSGNTYTIKKAYRPTDAMFGPLRPEQDWKW